MYSDIMLKILFDYCHGDVAQLSDLPEWSKPGGTLEEMSEGKAASALTQYLYALGSFVEYLIWCPRRFVSISPQKLVALKDQIKNWVAAERKQRNLQSMSCVAKSQQVVPVIAKNISGYDESEHYK